MPLETELTSETVVADSSCEHKTIKQGDACELPIEIYLNDTALGASDLASLDEIEFMLGPCVRKLVNAADAWSETKEAFMFPLDQADTLKLRPGIYGIDVRVQFASGGVLGNKNNLKIRVLRSESRKVIS